MSSFVIIKKNILLEGVRRSLRNSKIAIVFVALSFLLFIILILMVSKGDSLMVDQIAANYIQTVFSQKTYPFFEFITNFGDKVGIGIVAVLILIWGWVKKRDYVGMAAFVFAVALGNEFSKWLKEAIGRPRPDYLSLEDVETLSFPSGHAMVGLILYMFIAYFLMKETKSQLNRLIITMVAFVIIALIGVSRIVFQAHYPTDVIGGYSIGFIWTFLWISIYELLKLK